MGIEQLGGFLPCLTEIFVRQVVENFLHGLDVFHRNTFELSHACHSCLSHPRWALPFPLYAPFFKVANKVRKLLYTSLTSLNNRFKVRSSV